MPIDVSGFVSGPQQWAGLYHATDALEKRKLRQDQLAAQGQSRRASAGTFLQNYLDPKDYLTGTDYDPMIMHGLQELKQHGAMLAMQGADPPSLMMALGPMVNKIATYSTNAKTINKQVDDQIKLMKEGGHVGYDFAALKEEALKNAFYKTDPKTGQSQLDPDQADPSQNWIAKAIQSNPDKVTTAAGLDAFAKNSPINKTLTDIQSYTPQGELTRNKAHLIGQNWLVPEVDKRGATTGLVPKHDVATEAGNPIIHPFTDAKGNTTRAPLRLLDEGTFDDMMQRRPDIADYMNGVVQQHIGEYKDPDNGQQMTLDNPKAKLVARAIAYDELNRRKSATIEHAGIYDKPSPQQVTLNVNNTPEGLKYAHDRAAATTQGHLDAKGNTVNAVSAIGEIMNGNHEFLQGDTVDKDGKKVIDVTAEFPGGGLKAGRGTDFHYKGIYFDPHAKSLIVDKQITDDLGLKSTKTETIPEKDMGRFIYKIAESNGVKIATVKALLEKMGYKDGKFQKGTDANPQLDFENRQKNKPLSWRNALTKPLGNPVDLNQSETQ